MKGLFWQDIGIDIGTANTLVAVSGLGVVLREPSAVALAGGDRNKLAGVGSEALAMLGRTPGGVTVEYPLAGGVVSDYNLTEQMLKRFLQMALGRRMPLLGVRAVACAPGCLSGVERRALEEALKGAGVRDVQLMEEPLAAAIGADLPVEQAQGRMVVDLGAGTTSAATIALGGIVASESRRVGGRCIDRAIAEHVSQEHGVVVGEHTAEAVKFALASAVMGNSGSMSVRGRDIGSGLPREVQVTAGEINFAVRIPVREMLDTVRHTLKATPPEVAGDLLETGITLTGGGACLRDLDELIHYDTELPVYVAAAPVDCVALGALGAAQYLRGRRQKAGEPAQFQLPVS